MDTVEKIRLAPSLKHKTPEFTVKILGEERGTFRMFKPSANEMNKITKESHVKLFKSDLLVELFNALIFINM